MQSLGAIPALDLICHVDVCSFGLPVGAPGAVGSGGGEVVVGEVNAVSAVADGGEADNAGLERRGGGGEEEGFEELEEEEVGEVIGAELSFEAIGSEGTGGESHYAGVVYENVEGLSLGFQG